MNRSESPLATPTTSGERNAAGRITVERTRRGWSTAKVSDLMNAAGHVMNPSGVWRIENGQRRVRLDEALGFADVFGIALADLTAPPGPAAHARAAELIESVVQAHRAQDAAQASLDEATGILSSHLASHPEIADKAEACLRDALARATSPAPGPSCTKPFLNA